MNKTAILFGKGRVAIHAAELLLENEYDIRFVVPSAGDLDAISSLSGWATERGISVAETAILDDLDLRDVGLGLSVYFDRIFRQRHIDHFHTLLNVHNSLLPRYRGVRPINWALKDGETTHGVSLHEITAGIDEGAVLAQKSFRMDPHVDEVRDVYSRCLEAAEAMLEEALPDILSLRAVPQVEAEATYHSASEDEKLGDRRYWTRTDTYLA